MNVQVVREITWLGETERRFNDTIHAGACGLVEDRVSGAVGADARFVLKVEYPSGSYGSYGRITKGPTSVLMAAAPGRGGRS